MKLRETVFPYGVQELDYVALRRGIEQAFAEEYGPEVVREVRVAHFNPNVIDATVVVWTRRPEMDSLALEVSEVVRRRGMRVAIRVSTDDEGPMRCPEPVEGTRDE